jgi:hypothetical protein
MFPSYRGLGTVRVDGRDGTKAIGGGPSVRLWTGLTDPHRDGVGRPAQADATHETLVNP